MRICTHLFKLLLLLVLTAGAAHARSAATVSGDATLGVRQYSGESEGETQKATSFYQQYTVMVNKQAKFYDGRAGAYTLMAGYEINLLDPTYERNGVRDPEIAAIDTQKLYYKGNLVIAPGGLPFRLTLFAFDNKRSSFQSNARITEFDTGLQPGREISGSSSGHLVDPDIYSDLSNGTSHTLGGTLILGIRNGSYLGAYRDVLSKLPRLLIDYKQLTVKDLHGGFSESNYRTRDLAFVSLNKKDNWVHLRMRDHHDFVNPANDTRTQQVLIGTIDHLLTRQWINLTNWLRISGDLGYTSEKKVNEDPVNTYNLNLLFLGKRDNMAMSALTWFSRENDGKFITSTADIPLSMTVDFNRNTRLRSRFVFEDEKMTSVDGWTPVTIGPVNDYSAGAGDYRSFYLDNLFELQRGQLIVKPRLEVEARQQTGNQNSMALRAGAEVLNYRQQGNSLSWLGGYALTVNRHYDADEVAGGSFIQNEIYGRIEKNLGRKSRIGGRSSLEIGNGAGRQASGHIPVMSIGLPGGGAGGRATVDSNYSGMLTRGNIDLYFDHQYQRLGNRLNLSYDFFLADGIDATQSSLRHVLDYMETGHRFDWTSALNIGSSAEEAQTAAFDYLGAKSAATSKTDASWSSKVNYQYDPNRSAGLTLAGAISGRVGGGGGNDYSVSEKVFYRIFTSNGIVRRLAEFSEEIGYEKVNVSTNGRDNTLYGRLTGSYFPTRYFYAKLRSELVAFLGSSAMQQVGTAELGFDFEKLKIMASYSQGHKDRESELLPEVRERRWEMKVKKIF